MITDSSRFEPARPTRLVLARPTRPLRDHGARFQAGELVEEPERRPVLTQSAARSR